MIPIAIFCFVSALPVIPGQLSENPQALLNWCLDGKHHKSRPGPEEELYDQCSPWRKRSCCTHNTTRNAHHSNLYNFNYDHCSHKKNMSDECRRHFRQDLCFYECSPNIGPWTVRVSMSTRKERFYQVPLCQSDCIVWFNACVYDFTCIDNWVGKWKWTDQGNICPQGSECRTFKEVFGNAQNFCEKVWDDAWKYTPDDQSCMRIWFNGQNGNPNDNIARLRVQQLMRQNKAGSVKNSDILSVLIAVATLFVQ